MKTFFTAMLLTLSMALYSQMSLNYTNPIDTGVGLNRVITYPNVAIHGNQSLDLIVCINEYNSSNPLDTNWYSSVQFRAVAGDFNLKIPYSDTFSRCVDLTFKLVEAGTLNFITVDFNSTVFDLDSSDLRNEYIIVNDFESYTLTNPTLIEVTNYADSTEFHSTDDVNINDMRASVDLAFNSNFSINYCVDAYNNGGNSGFFMSTVVDSFIIMALGDVILLDFVGYSDGCVNYLEWVVTQENNLESYELQYSRDGIYFITFDTVNPENRGSYSYYLLSHTNNNYYRIVYNYIDNTKEISKVIYVESDCVKNKTKLFPNPAKDVVNVISDRKIDVIELFNDGGLKMTEFLINNQDEIFINILSYQNSTFYVKIKYNDGSTETLKLVKYL